jgi:hypothetical protein
MSNKYVGFKLRIFEQRKKFNELPLVKNKIKIYLLFILLIEISNKESKR